MKDILINGYYITYDNPKVKVPLEPQEEIQLQKLNLIELVLPMCKKIECGGNLLKKLIIPPGCESVSCHNNKLTKLIIPMGCTYV